MPVPPPPRSDHDFKTFYREQRARMIALAIALSGAKLYDPEQTAETGWQKFYPHWENCEKPAAYLRTCVRNAVNDELRANAIFTASFDHHKTVAELVAALSAGRRPASPGESWRNWTSWDPPLAEAIAKLSGKLREAVVLDTELNPGERTVAETAEILGISRVTAHMRLKRAYAQLERLLPDRYLEERRERLRDAGGLEERSAP